VTVPQGFTAFLYSDGTNVGYATNGLPAYARSVSGNPNSQLAGTAGSVNTNASLAFDYTNSIFYICTTTGSASTAVWSAVAISALLNWTTAGRPGSPATGQIGFNTTLATMDVYDGAVWRNPPQSQLIAAGFKNLVIQNNSGTPNTQIDLDADALDLGHQRLRREQEHVTLTNRPIPGLTDRLQRRIERILTRRAIGVEAAL